FENYGGSHHSLAAHAPILHTQSPQARDSIQFVWEAVMQSPQARDSLQFVWEAVMGPNFGVPLKPPGWGGCGKCRGSQRYQPDFRGFDDCPQVQNLDLEPACIPSKTNEKTSNTNYL